MLEKTLESPLDCNGNKPVSPKGNQSWVFIGRTDAEDPIHWAPDVKNWLIGKDPDAGKDWRQEEKWMTEDEVVGWHQSSMDMSLSKLQELVMDREAWCAAGFAKSQGHKVWDTTEWCNWTVQTWESSLPPSDYILWRLLVICVPRWCFFLDILLRSHRDQ